MQESPGARNALLRFYEAFTEAVAGDMASFDRVFSREEDLLIIGSAYHEWVDSREKGKGAWGMEGVRLEAGDPVGWERDSVAWAADRPSFVPRRRADPDPDPRCDARGGRRAQDRHRAFLRRRPRRGRGRERRRVERGYSNALTPALQSSTGLRRSISLRFG